MPIAAVLTMLTQNPAISTMPIDINVSDLADSVITRWRQIDLALTPIIGRRGILAIYKKALNLTQVDFPWLPVLSEDDNSFDFASLQAALVRQTSAAVMAANLALHRSFNKLLVSLIGESLSERLLQSIDACFHREATHLQDSDLLPQREYA